MKTFVINLDRRQDRLEYMKNHLQFHEIPSFEKISAIVLTANIYLMLLH